MSAKVKQGGSEVRRVHGSLVHHTVKRAGSITSEHSQVL